MPMMLALIAHDAKKPDMAAWVTRNQGALAGHRIVCTATTGSIIKARCPDLAIQTVKSGPLGGDQQIGALIAEGRIGALVFFADPLTPMPHDVDVKALTRLALVYDIAFALNPRTADLLVLSGLLAALSAPPPRLQATASPIGQDTPVPPSPQ